MNEDENGIEWFSFTEDNIEGVMERMKEVGGLIEKCETSDLIKFYKEYSKLNNLYDNDGNYLINEEIISDFNDYIITNTLVELQKKGLIETMWDDKEQDFVFKAKEFKNETPKD